MTLDYGPTAVNRTACSHAVPPIRTRRVFIDGFYRRADAPVERAGRIRSQGINTNWGKKFRRILSFSPQLDGRIGIDHREITKIGVEEQSNYVARASQSPDRGRDASIAQAPPPPRRANEPIATIRVAL